MAQVIVIPARLSSTRLPRKVLLDETGWPLIRHVYTRCSVVPNVERVVVAADSPEIVDVVEGFGGEAVLTDPGLPTGTDRVAAAARTLALDEQRDRLVNVQGDEPQMEPSHVTALFGLLGESDDASVATLAVSRHDLAGFQDPNRVKVVCDGDGFALYFSRAGIPHPRDGEVPDPWLCHLGIYGFRPGALGRFESHGPAPMERRERLEQLRFLEMGLRIRVGLVERATPGVDTPEDYRRFVEDCRDRGLTEEPGGVQGREGAE